MTDQQRYDKLLMLANNLRRAYWDFRKYGGKSYYQKQKDTGAELDKFLREENKIRESLQKQLSP